MAGYLRDFDWSIPLTLGNQKFPTTTMGIEEPDGTVKKRQVFVDSKGNYYGVENGMPIPVMMQHNLDEVVVTPSKEVKRGLLSDAFNQYLTMSNDKTKVNNIPNQNSVSPLIEEALKRERKDIIVSSLNSSEDNVDGVEGNALHKLLSTFISQKKHSPMYREALSPYSYEDDLDYNSKVSQGLTTTGNELSSKLGNLGLVKVGDNKYRLYDEKGNIIKECAQTRNELEKMVKRPTTNNAWDTFGIYGDSTLFNGYLPKIGPYFKPSYVLQNQIAADRTQRAIENLNLQTGDVVDLYNPFSNYAETAYNKGTLNRSNSHTGMIFQPYPGAKSKTYIIHNVNGNISVDPIGKFLFSQDNPFPKWRMTGFHRPGTKEHPYLKNGKPTHL